MTAPRQKELRLALICYGGVSLAVYMHGVTRELWKLLRASEAMAGGRAGPPGDTEPHWRDLLDSFSPDLELRVLCDIVAGASAGGLNAVLLAHAIATGASLEPLRRLWLEGADVDRLLAPEAQPRLRLGGRLAAFYKEPVAWFAARQSATLAAVDDDAVRAEMAVKLARFVRARWFQPPFSGDTLVALLDEAMDAMEAAADNPALIPPSLPLTLFVTATDWDGRRATLPIHSPSAVTEKEHRRLFTFEASPQFRVGDFGPRPPVAARALGERPALIFAARATASFPGAFAPATVGEIDAHFTATGRPWPGRAQFLAKQLPGERPPEAVRLIDGSVLMNAPFAPAIAAVRTRPANREVDRRFVYIDPKPGLPGPTDGFDAKPPGFFTTILRALADIPREQPIRDSLEALNSLSAQVRRVRSVVDAMAPAVDVAIERAVGARFFLMPLTAARVSAARARIQSVAAREAGFAYAGYAQLKVRGVLDQAAELLAGQLGSEGALVARARIRAGLEAAAQARGAFDASAATGRRPTRSAYVELLRGLDIGFRIRRARFLLRRLVAEMAEVGDPAERARIERLRRDLYAALAPFLALRSGQGLADPALAAAAQALTRSAHGVEEGATAIDLLTAALDLPSLDRAADAVLFAAATDPAISRERRRRAVRAFLGFPFYDIAILPMMQDEAADSFDEIRVDRISPDDATSLRAGGTRACLKGWQLNNFGAFFSRAWRENDYLWGRLHGVDRLVDILVASARESGADPGPIMEWKRRLFLAILEAEREKLGESAALIDELLGVVDGWG